MNRCHRRLACLSKRKDGGRSYSIDHRDCADYHRILRSYPQSYTKKPRITGALCYPILSLEPVALIKLVVAV
jgi:hypothetical protein